MTVLQGSSVDLYVMTMTQYMNSYPEEGRLPSVSFSPESVQNTTSATLHFTYGSDSYEDDFDGIYIVVDNRDCSLTPSDAVPQGQVTVSLEVDASYGDWYYDDYFDEYMLLCSILPIVTIIVIAAVLVYAIKSSSKRNQVPPPPQWPSPPAKPPVE